MPFNKEHLRKAGEAVIAKLEPRADRLVHTRSSWRTLPGKIKREAPPGPEMTEVEFKDAMENLSQDAARWRCMRLNFSAILARVLEHDRLPSYSDFLIEVDQLRGAEVQKPRR
jgi:hypothetical protein